MRSTLAIIVATLPLTAACTMNVSTPTALADIDTPTVSIEADNDPTGIYGAIVPSSMVTVRVSNTDCVRITDEVTATFDGRPLGSIGRGGWEDSVIDGTCTSAAFAFLGPTTRATSSLVIADSTATWTIDASRLFANDLVLESSATSPVHLTWGSAGEITQADAELSDADGVLVWSSHNFGDAVPSASVAVIGNVLAVTAPSMGTGVRTLAVSATRAADADVCDGPARCAITARAGREFPLE